MDLASELLERLESKDYRAVKSLANEGGTEPLAEAWPRLPLFERLIVFKLLSPQRAWALFQSLGYEDRYALFTGFDAQAIAPVLESLPPGERSLFEPLPESDYEKMAGTLGS